MLIKINLVFLWVFLQMLLLAGCAPQPVQRTEGSLPPTDSQVRGLAKPEASGDPPARPAGNLYPTNEQVIAKGQLLFQNNCSACHNFRQREIGPNLAGVTTLVSADWLKNFIRNAPAMIQSGDERATRLYQEYNQMMPPFPSLSEADIEALLAYMHKQKESLPADAEVANLGAILKDPITSKILTSGLTLNLKSVLQVPASGVKTPLARINKMRVLPGENERHFIQDLRGKLYELEEQKVRVFMDINQERPGFIHTPGLATGFGSFAFHPEYAINGLFYTTHTEKAGAAPADFAYADSISVALQWVLTEWKMQDPAGSVFSGSSREMLRVNMVTQVHGVQEIAFNTLARPGHPDYGLLYIGVGDGGAAGAGHPHLCRDNNHIWGSVIRIDPRGTNSKNGRYGTPASNPFAQDGNPSSLGEIYVRGFRNPNRVSWAPDGKMLIADIGHANIEELNLGTPGADYGWPDREGTFLLSPKGKMDLVYALPADDASKYTYPVAQFDHDEGNAISGGYVYAGTEAPHLRGKYIFGDIVNGRIFFVDSDQIKRGYLAPIQELAIQVDGKETTFRDLTGSSKTDLRFGLGPKNELFIFTKADGRIYKVSGSSGKAHSQSRK